MLVRAPALPVDSIAVAPPAFTSLPPGSRENRMLCGLLESLFRFVHGWIPTSKPREQVAIRGLSANLKEQSGVGKMARTVTRRFLNV